MFLDEKQLKRATGYYNVIKNFIVMKPDDYIESGIQICKDCHGTGLGGVWKSSLGGDDHGWDPNNYCDKCYGVGFININKKLKALSDEIFICNNCQGVGCSKCNLSGMVDWVANIMGR